MYRIVQSLYCTTESYITLYVNYISIKELEFFSIYIVLKPWVSHLRDLVQIGWNATTLGIWTGEEVPGKEIKKLESIRFMEHQ